MSDARTTLEVILKTAGFTEGATAIKKVGDEATNTNAKLKTTASTVDQVSKSTTSLGSKLKNAGSQFSGTITSVSTLGATVLNLSRQYQDLSDSQIRVDKTQLKVSRTAEALKAAQGKLNTLVKQGVKDGAAYQQALLDVQQAQDAATLATTMHGEALEDQQRNFENFFIGLAPTVLAAGGSITSMFKEMGGEKGIGGLTGKLKELPASLGMSTKAFVGMAGAIGLASVAMVELVSQLQRGGEIKALQKFNEGPGATTDSIQREIAKLKEQKASWGQALKDFFTPRFGQDTGAHIIDEVVKSLESKESRMEGAKAVSDYFTSVMSLPIAQPVKDAIRARQQEIAAFYANPNNWRDEANAAFTRNAISLDILLMEALAKAGTAASPFVKLAETMRASTEKAGRDVLNTFVDAMAGGTSGGFQSALEKAGLSFKPMADTIGKTIDQVEKVASQGLGKWDAVIQQSVDKQAAFDETMKTSWAAFDEVVNTTTQGASAGIEAYNKTLTDMQTGTVTGINKMLASWNKLHKDTKVTIPVKGKHGKQIGERTMTQKFTDPIEAAGGILDKLQSGFLDKLASGVPKSAETFAVNWVKTVASKLSGTSAQILAPIKTYIQQHASEAPEVFITGFSNFLAKTDLSANFAAAFAPVTTEATTAAKEAGISIGESLSFPNDKMKESTTLAWQLADAMKKIPPKTKPVVSAAVLGKEKVDLMAKAIAAIKSKKVVLTVSAQIGNNVQQAVNMAARFSGSGAHPGRGSLKTGATGYLGTVKKPTFFLAGEGGRQEDISIKPRGSAGGSGGGMTVNVYVDGVQRPARYDMGARK